jgi:FkbM family methyltransferase
MSAVVVCRYRCTLLSIVLVGSTLAYACLMFVQLWSLKGILGHDRRADELIGWFLPSSPRSPHLFVPSSISHRSTAGQHTRNSSNQQIISTLATRLEFYQQFYRYRPPKRHFKALPKECGAPPHYADFFQQTWRFHSRVKEDETIYKLFLQPKLAPAKATNNNSTSQYSYVELGAFDGVKESNSRFFDDCLKWPGVLIEANPRMYDELLRQRQHAHKFWLAPTCSMMDQSNRQNNVNNNDLNQTILFHDYRYTNAGVLGAAKDFHGGHRTTPVPCGSLTPIVQDILHGHVTFLSLDVEGSELMVLDQLDWSQLSIDILLIEIFNKHCRDVCPMRDEIRRRMEQNGYTRYQGLVKHSDVYVHVQSEFYNVSLHKPILQSYPYVVIAVPGEAEQAATSTV